MARVRPLRGVALYIAALLVISGIAIAGWLLFLAFAPILTRTPVGLSLAVVALMAGVASFFSPCSFSLIPALFAHFASVRESRFGILTYGLVTALGVLAFLTILAILIGILGQSIAGVVAISEVAIWVRRIVGLILIVLGILQFGFSFGRLENLRDIVRRTTLSWAPRSPLFASFLFGFGYTLAGIG